MSLELRAVRKTFEAGRVRPHQATVMYPPDRTLFARYARRGAIRRSLNTPETWERTGHRLGLYLHVPFCETKCAFCDYATVIGPRFRELADVYVNNLIAELRHWREVLPGAIVLTGLDIGGGTPLTLTPAHFAQLATTVRDSFDVCDDFEISTETTPSIVVNADRSTMVEYREAGVDRLSIGVQSLDDDVLRTGTRAVHSRERVVQAMGIVRKAGFAFVNLDLMFAQLGQSLTSWTSTVMAAIALQPDVVTIYDTVYKRRGINTLARRTTGLPHRRTYGDQYDVAWTLLTNAGFSADYGSVNFSRVAGRLGTSRYLESRILDLVPYVGAGLYASSLIGSAWGFNHRRLSTWARFTSNGLSHGHEYELPTEHVAAKCALLMLSYGFLDERRFHRRFARSLASFFGPALAELTRRGLLRHTEGRYHMVPGSFGALPGIRTALMPTQAADWIAGKTPQPGRIHEAHVKLESEPGAAEVATDLAAAAPTADG